MPMCQWSITSLSPIAFSCLPTSGVTPFASCSSPWIRRCKPMLLRQEPCHVNLARALRDHLAGDCAALTKNYVIRDTEGSCQPSTTITASKQPSKPLIENRWSCTFLFKIFSYNILRHVTNANSSYKSNYRDTPWSVNGEVRRLSSHFRHLATVDSCDGHGSQSV